ncbi:hypothetical protein Tco_0507469, partial [Tanacetum coccineum]
TDDVEIVKIRDPVGFYVVGKDGTRTWYPDLLPHREKPIEVAYCKKAGFDVRRGREYKAVGFDDATTKYFYCTKEGFLLNPKENYGVRSLDVDILEHSEVSDGFERFRDVKTFIKSNRKWEFEIGFLVLFFLIFGAGYKDGTVNERIVPFLANTDMVCQMDWCSYCLECMVKECTNFNPNKNFSGPLVLMAVMYVNSIVSAKVKAEKTDLVILGCNNTLLLKRQKEELDLGGFGLLLIVEGLEFIEPKKKKVIKKKKSKIVIEEKDATQDKVEEIEDFKSKSLEVSPPRTPDIYEKNMYSRYRCPLQEHPGSNVPLIGVPSKNTQAVMYPLVAVAGGGDGDGAWTSGSSRSGDGEAFGTWSENSQKKFSGG